jgi:hypothetical protein
MTYLEISRNKVRHKMSRSHAKILYTINKKES